MRRRWIPRRRVSNELKVIGSLKDPKVGIRDHLYFLRSLKRELQYTPKKDLEKWRPRYTNRKKKNAE
jgi:hypothetical protein